MPIHCRNAFVKYGYSTSSILRGKQRWRIETKIFAGEGSKWEKGVIAELTAMVNIGNESI